MGHSLKLLIALLLLTLTTTLSARVETNRLPSEAHLPDPGLSLESFRPLSSPLDELVAKKEDTVIKVYVNEKATRLSDDLPEYFGAFPGVIIGFATLSLPPAYEIVHSNIPGIIFAVAILFGFLATHSTHVRKQALREDIPSSS